MLRASSIASHTSRHPRLKIVEHEIASIGRHHQHRLPLAVRLANYSNKKRACRPAQLDEGPPFREHMILAVPRTRRIDPVLGDIVERDIGARSDLAAAVRPTNGAWSARGSHCFGQVRQKSRALNGNRLWVPRGQDRLSLQRRSLAFGR